MITVKIKGGLGNQMFQYACGKTVSLKRQLPLQLDISFFEHNALTKIDAPRTFSLNVFNLEPFVTTKEPIIHNDSQGLTFIKKVLRKIKILLREKTNEPSLEKILKSKQTLLDGYWQSETYFEDNKDQIRKEFTLKNQLGEGAQQIKKLIESATQTASIHVRRGDYVTNKNTNAHHGTCSSEYYKEGISYILGKYPECTFFVFSDDIAWVKENLPAPQNVCFVSDPSRIKDEEEMILMSLCTHHIIANSSFSWWGAWLGERVNSIVIAPKKWFGNVETPDNLLPKRWKQI